MTFLKDNVMCDDENFDCMLINPLKLSSLHSVNNANYSGNDIRNECFYITMCNEIICFEYIKSSGTA